MQSAANGLRRLSGVRLSAYRSVCASGVAAITFSSGGESGHCRGRGLLFTGGMPRPTFAESSTPALCLIWVADRRQTASAATRHGPSN